MNIKRGRKGQVTVFIIIALLIIAAVLIILFLAGKPAVEVVSMEDPAAFIRECTGDAVNDATAIMFAQGGYIEEPKKYKLYENNKVAFLCYNKNYYEPCINIEPFYIEKLESEIKTYTEPKIKECFFTLKKELEKRNYDVSMNELKMSIQLVPDNVKVEINNTLKMTKNEEKKEFEKFDSVVKSSMYNVGRIAVDIAQQEAEFCNFEYLGYMLMHPNFEIKKNSIGGNEDFSVIYTIKDRAYDDELNIAIRGCAIPTGI